VGRHYASFPGDTPKISELQRTKKGCEGEQLFPGKESDGEGRERRKVAESLRTPGGLLVSFLKTWQREKGQGQNQAGDESSLTTGRRSIFLLNGSMKNVRTFALRVGG